MNVLVTGGGGFVGSHIVERLVGDGYRVRVIDNFSTGRRENLDEVVAEIDLIEEDICAYERVREAAEGCEVILHQAALPSIPRSIDDPLASHAANITGTLNVLLAARDAGVRRVVLASSSSVYGPQDSFPTSEGLRPDPISPYAVGKLAAEGYARSFAAVYGGETVALRYFNVFGPRQDPLSPYASAIPAFIAAFLDGRPPLVFGDGEQSRDFTYVDNVVEANLLAIGAAGVSGGAYNVACGESTTLNEVLAELSRLTGRSISAEYAPPRAGQVRHSLADISRARRELGYRPRVRFSEGLRRTLAYYLSDRAPALPDGGRIRAAP